MAVITRCDGVLFKRSLHGSHSWLTANRDKINQLNVFPVPLPRPRAMESRADPHFGALCVDIYAALARAPEAAE